MIDPNDLGSDVSCMVGTPPDLDATFGILTGPRVVAEAVARRLTTPRGLLPEDPEYGFDVRSLLNATLSPTALFVAEASIVAESEKDERVASAAVGFSYNAPATTLQIAVKLQTLAGPFALVLDVTAAAIRFHTEAI